MSIATQLANMSLATLLGNAARINKMKHNLRESYTEMGFRFDETFWATYNHYRMNVDRYTDEIHRRTGAEFWIMNEALHSSTPVSTFDAMVALDKAEKAEQAA